MSATPEQVPAAVFRANMREYTARVLQGNATIALTHHGFEAAIVVSPVWFARALAALGED